MSDVINPIPTPLNSILLQLGVIASIERGQKMNMSNMTFTDASSWWGSLFRSLSGEGRKHTLSHLNLIIQQSFSAIQEYHNTEFLPIIVNALARAKIGISNLAATYQKCPSTASALNLIIQNIDLQLGKHADKLEGHVK